MDLVLYLAVSGGILLLAYRILAPRLVVWLGVGLTRDMPAHVQRDGVDFEPLAPASLLPQHFSAIAAAGPIVGPILAGTLFGWGPTWIWILAGSILIGGVHDLTTLLASVRHKARSIAEVVREYMNPRAYRLFLLFIWISLVYVIIAFADVTAGAFVQSAPAGGAEAPGPAVATSSILYLLLAVAMGLVLRFTKTTGGAAKAVFLPLVLGAILVGPHLPLAWGTARTWNYALLGYCFLASIAPVWLLLQPRGELGGYFLYLITGAGVFGILVGGLRGDLAIQAPAFVVPTAGGPPLFPVLFITVACGACSGFHSIVTSGTTSKQLDREADATPIAYGSMLLEAFFACLSLATVMILAAPTGKPDALYAQGIAKFLHHAAFGTVSEGILYQFALLCFATFVFDTLDACTRLARYILMELTGWMGTRGMALATALTLAIPLVIASLPPAEVAGKAVPVWRVFWALFGSSNQMLAALALLAVSVWLHKTGRNAAWPLAGSVFMLVMTIWSLSLAAKGYLARTGPVAMLHHVEFGVSGLLILLGLWLVGEAAATWRRASRSSS